MEDLDIVATLIILSKFVTKFRPVFIYNKNGTWGGGGLSSQLRTSVCLWMKMHLPYTLRRRRRPRPRIAEAWWQPKLTRSVIVFRHSFDGFVQAFTYLPCPNTPLRESLVGSIALCLKCPICVYRRHKMIAFSGSKFRIVTMFVTWITNGISYMTCRYVYELGIGTGGELFWMR